MKTVILMINHKLVKVGLAAIVVVLMIVSVFYIRTNMVGQTGNHVVLAQPQTGSAEKNLYREILITALDPYIQQAVSDYYGKNVSNYYGKYVMAPPYMVRVMDAKKNNNEQIYDVTFEVEPYIGPHDEVGIDQMTLSISPIKIDVTDFKHIKSFSLPSNMQGQPAK